MNKKPHVTRTSKRDDYCTPPNLFKRLNEIYAFTVDAAASDHNALCEVWVTEDMNSKFDHEIWGERIFCNPPFSKKNEFFQWLLDQRNDNHLIAFLVPNNARETNWWYLHVAYKADKVINITPRVNYYLDGEPTRGVAFGSALILYYPRLVGEYYSPPKESYWEFGN